MSKSVRVRFAPSPTGYLHIGGARTALFNWLYARKHKGTFILRIEDTDRERSTPESVKAILDGLKWLGIDWDEGPEVGGSYAPYFQTERLNTYQAHAEKLMAEGRAYRCYCTKEELEERRQWHEARKLTYRYEGTCRNRAPVEGRTSVLRFRMPDGEGTVSFDDKVLGRISKQYSDLDDWVMMRADGIPLYNYGCVIDDHLMDITLVGRGQEHVNSTFPQLMLYQALGWTPPDFAHFPLILGPDREKLSKRKHPEADVMLHAKTGILHEALNNFVVRLGWSHGNDEVISREQMTEWFDFDHVGTTSGVWNPDKLLWLNQHYIKTLPSKELAQRVVPFLNQLGIQTEATPRLERMIDIFRERAKTLVEMAEKCAPYFSSDMVMDEKAATKHLTASIKPALTKVLDLLNSLPAWAAHDIDGVIGQVAQQESLGMGKIAQPMRVAVTGGTVSPGIGETLELIGKEESLRRIDAALKRM